jgi:hypothetical protein
MKDFFILALAFSALVLHAQSAHALKIKTGAFKKVMILVFENSDYEDALKQPFFAKFAKDGTLLTNYHGATHPSQGNYIALIAGDMLGVTDDYDFNLDGNHVGDLLEAKGKTWRVYAEDFPGNCSLRSVSGRYARKHNPFISFKNIQQNPSRCRNIVNASTLQSDIQNGTLADYSFYIPNLNNDGHDTGVGYADKWFSRTFGPLIQDPRFMNGMLLVATFDEGEDDPTNHIYTVLLGAGVKANVTFNKNVNHYSLLRMIEDGFGLGTLGRKDAQAETIDAF